MPYLGETLALLTAVCWALAVILFKKSGEAVHPIGLNLFKDLMAVALLLPTIYLFGESLFYPGSAWDYALLFASGALGIGVADTLFFKSLNALGAGLTAIVDCLYSPTIITLAIMFLGETMGLWQVIGASLIISAVLTVSAEGGKTPDDKKRIAMGVLWGALAMIANACGVVMIKPLLDRSPLFWVTEMRLVGGVAVLVLVLAAHPARRAILATIRSPQRWGYTLAGSFVGAYLSMVLWLAGMKYTNASIAAALNQTSNIFIFVFAALLLKEPITPWRTLGIVLGVGGALMVTFL